MNDNPTEPTEAMVSVPYWAVAAIVDPLRMVYIDNLGSCLYCNPYDDPGQARPGTESPDSTVHTSDCPVRALQETLGINHG